MKSNVWMWLNFRYRALLHLSKAPPKENYDLSGEGQFPLVRYF